MRNSVPPFLYVYCPDNRNDIRLLVFIDWLFVVQDFLDYFLNYVYSLLNMAKRKKLNKKNLQSLIADEAMKLNKLSEDECMLQNIL